MILDKFNFRKKVIILQFYLVYGVDWSKNNTENIKKVLNLVFH